MQKRPNAPSKAIVRFGPERHSPPVATTSLVTVPIPALVLGLLGLAAVLYVTLRSWHTRRTDGQALAGKPGGLEITAVVLLLIGGFLLLIGWVVGCDQLSLSPRRRWTDKLLGTLVWPGGLAPYLFMGWTIAGQVCTGSSGMPPTCTSYGPPPWVGDATLVIFVLGQVAVAVWLLRRASKQPSQAITAALLS